MDIKKSLIRFTSLLLSCLMVLSTPITALADGNLNQNASSDGLIPAGVDAAYAHKFYAYPTNQGWRFTIVNKEGVQVSNSVDAVTYFPGDIEKLAGEASKGGDMNISSSTGSISEMVAGYKKYKSWLGWSDFSNNGLNMTKDNQIWYSNGIKTTDWSDPSARLAWNRTSVPYTTTSEGSIQNKVYPIRILNTFLYMAVSDKIKEEGKTPDEKELANLKIPVPSKMNGAAIEPGGADLLELAKHNLGDYTVEKEHLQDNIIKIILNASGPVYTSDCQDTGSNDHFFRYINPEDNARIGTLDASGNKITVAQIFQEKQYRLAVEPIYFCVPELVTFDTGLIQKYGTAHLMWLTGVVYGTVSYINKYVYELATNIKDTNGNQKYTDEDLQKCTVYPDWAWGDMGPTTAMLSKNEDLMKIYEPSTEGHDLQKLDRGYSLYSMAADDRYKSVGYALHLYTPDMLEDASGTPTWDDKTYPSDNYQPGPAPDTSNEEEYPKETTYDTANNKANIVKFYVRKQGNTEVPLNNYTRENTLHTIDIK